MRFFTGSPANKDAEREAQKREWDQVIEKAQQLKAEAEEQKLKLMNGHRYEIERKEK